MFQTKVTEKFKTHFEFNNLFFENRALYEIMWKNTEEWDKTRVATWRMRIACWITKATNSHSEYVVPRFNVFPLQEWLDERASMLCVCLF